MPVLCGFQPAPTSFGLAMVRQADDCSRWEIGEEPQLPIALGLLISDCSRWEIGEEPQRVGVHPAHKVHCSRWEIGEEPQLDGPVCQTVEIVADGRSGRNRNLDVHA